MRNFAVFFLFFILIYSCQEDDIIIPQDTFTNIMFDIQLKETTIQQLSRSINIPGDERPYYYKSILAKYDVSVAQFDSSYKYYAGRPELMNEIYNDVIDRLSAMEVALTSDKSLRTDSVLADSLLAILAEQKADSNILNIWQMPTTYSFPRNGGDENSIPFSILRPYETNKDYQLKMVMKLDEKDGSIRPTMNIRLDYNDNTFEESTLLLEKANRPSLYALKIDSDSAKKVIKVSGDLYTHGRVTDSKRATIYDVTLFVLPKEN